MRGEPESKTPTLIESLFLGKMTDQELSLLNMSDGDISQDEVDFTAGHEEKASHQRQGVANNNNDNSSSRSSSGALPKPETKPPEASDDDDDDDNKEVREVDSQQSDAGPSLGSNWQSVEYGNESGRRHALTEFIDLVNQIRYNFGMMVNNKHVQFCIIVLIAINALMMGIATFKVVREDPELKDTFEVVDRLFLILFTVELGMQFVFLGWRILLDGWLVFDLVIIGLSWKFTQLEIIRAFRIFRALRLITRIKIMKNLILALFGVMPRMAAIGLMLCLIFYIFAVMFTQLFKEIDFGENDYFGRIDETFFTLFQIMTLDNWADIAREVIVAEVRGTGNRVTEFKWAWAPFVAFVVISGFIVVNLIIAVICDAISALHKDDKARIHGTYDENSESENSSQEPEIREQLDCLEEQMEELTRIQAKTFHTLQYLTRQMQMQKLKQEIAQKSSTQLRVTNHEHKKRPANQIVSRLGKEKAVRNTNRKHQ